MVADDSFVEGALPDFAQDLPGIFLEESLPAFVFSNGFVCSDDLTESGAGSPLDLGECDFGMGGFGMGDFEKGDGLGDREGRPYEVEGRIIPIIE